MSGRTSGNISARSATTTATAARYASIHGGSATSWIAINASRTVATTTDVSIAVTAGVGAGDGGAVTVGSSISDFLVPEWNHGESAGLSELARHIFFELPSQRQKGWRSLSISTLFIVGADFP